MRKKSVRLRRHRVVLVASPGVPLFEFAIAAEVFGIDRRQLTANWYEFTIAAVNETGTEIAHGITVPATAGLAALRRADTVIVPACADVHAHAPTVLLDALRRAHAGGARIAAICSGSFVLAEAGLLAGRRATTHWIHAAELAARYPDVTVDPAVLYVHDDVWTSAGSAAGLDMCLELVRQDHGAAIANDVARHIVTSPHRTGGQAQFIPSTKVSPTMSGPDVQDWARRNVAEATVATMAGYAGVSQRTLNRRFRDYVHLSPQQWLQDARLDVAVEHLETTDLTVDAIARRAGMGSATNLRAQFTKTYGVSPSQYRQTFHQRKGATVPHPGEPHHG
jgi:AraC family transcriptional regulator, transcriptional activator FtrA